MSVGIRYRPKTWLSNSYGHAYLKWASRLLVGTCRQLELADGCPLKQPLGRTGGGEMEGYWKMLCRECPC
jgi:hypothetical protein